MNDLTFVYRSFKVTSSIGSHSPLNISETVSDKVLIPTTTNRKWPTGNQMVT